MLVKLYIPNVMHIYKFECEKSRLVYPITAVQSLQETQCSVWIQIICLSKKL